MGDFVISSLVMSGLEMRIFSRITAFSTT